MDDDDDDSLHSQPQSPVVSLRLIHVSNLYYVDFWSYTKLICIFKCVLQETKPVVKKKAPGRREELLKQLKAVEDAIAKKRSKIL